MAVHDLWYLSKRDPDGKRLPSRRHGRGKRWRVTWTDDNGNERTAHFERKPDAERHNSNVHADLSRGQYIDDRAGRITVAELGDNWRSSQLHVDTTAVRVEHSLRLHIADTALGRRQIREVRSSHVQAWVKDRSAVLAPTTLRVVYSYLCSMFLMAVRDRLVASTPCDSISLPEIDRRDRFIPAADQIHRLGA